MTTQTLLDWITVLAFFALLVVPAVIGHAKGRRMDRQLARAERRPLGNDEGTGHSQRERFSRAA
ncbi:hypothetical protein [Streptomyces sp. KLOTTS4A1]|uniref:hypothetical protein n=1 Tax=Streptomyces sp. KLOTTS4A1 TaxID=3390996 RepID=UPI0039F54A43